MTSYGRRTFFIFTLTTIIYWAAGAAQEPGQQPQGPRIDWQRGPAVGHLGDIAEINVPEGYQFAGKQGAQTILQLTHNIPNGKELGVLVSSDPNSNWFMVFRFDDTGHIKDDEKDSLDANAILQNIKDGTEAANEKRKQQGWAAFHVLGWERPPYYDPQTHNLTWAIQGRGDDANEPPTVNHSIRLLGRRGTINVNLVASPQEYAASRADFDMLISGFSYKPGHRYMDFVKGDKSFEYGLAALIAGVDRPVQLAEKLVTINENSNSNLLIGIVVGIFLAAVAIGGYGYHQHRLALKSAESAKAPPLPGQR